MRAASHRPRAQRLTRACAQNPIEKAKLAKDASNAFNDVYSFAAAIREGSLDWEDIEKVAPAANVLASLPASFPWRMHPSARALGRWT